MTGPHEHLRDQPIVLASGNPKKLAEMREILGTLGLSVVGLNELGEDLPEPEETGDTFAENARIKALAYAEMTGRPSLADDSGLVVDALGGEPGVFSARYSEKEKPGDLPRADRDRLNNEKLMQRLGSTPPEQRTARFVCSMCLAVPDQAVSGSKNKATLLAESSGSFEGRIGLSGQVPRGTHGFGYDPLFLAAPDFARTSAELSPEEKHAMSHRGQAARAIAAQIADLLRE